MSLQMPEGHISLTPPTIAGLYKAWIEKDFPGAKLTIEHGHNRVTLTNGGDLRLGWEHSDPWLAVATEAEFRTAYENPVVQAHIKLAVKL